MDQILSTTIEGVSAIKAGVMPLSLRSDPTCPRLLLSIWGNQIDDLSPISAQGSNTAFRPGVQRPEYLISNEHSQVPGY